METNLVYLVSIEITVNNQLKQTILEQANELFLKYGYVKTSMDEIALKLKISKKTIYSLFKNKEGLAYNLILRHLSEIDKQFKYLIKQKLDFNQLLTRTMQILAAKISEIGDFLKEENPKLTALFKKLRSKRDEIIINFFCKVFRHGKRNGFLQPKLKENIFIFILLNILQSFFSPGALAKNPISSLELFQTIASLILTGVLTDKGRRQLMLSEI